MKVPRHLERGALRVEMTPMIDVVFLLLVFFLWTSSFDAPEFDLPGQLATPPSGSEAQATPPSEAPMFDELVIKVQAAGDDAVFQLGEERVGDKATLLARLAAIAALGVQPPVIIDPDRNVAMQHAIAAYDAARAAGLNDCLFAIPAPE